MLLKMEIFWNFTLRISLTWSNRIKFMSSRKLTHNRIYEKLLKIECWFKSHSQSKKCRRAVQCGIFVEKWLKIESVSKNHSKLYVIRKATHSQILFEKRLIFNFLLKSHSQSHFFRNFGHKWMFVEKLRIFENLWKVTIDFFIGKPLTFEFTKSRLELNVFQIDFQNHSKLNNYQKAFKMGS